MGVDDDEISKIYSMVGGDRIECVTAGFMR